jgi:hypothetical protein
MATKVIHTKILDLLKTQNLTTRELAQAIGLLERKQHCQLHSAIQTLLNNGSIIRAHAERSRRNTKYALVSEAPDKPIDSKNVFLNEEMAMDKYMAHYKARLRKIFEAACRFIELPNNDPTRLNFSRVK